MTTVRRWERGTSTPSPATRPDLAEALNLSLDELDALLTEHPETTAPPAATANRRGTLQSPVSEPPSLAAALGINDALSHFDDNALDFLLSPESAPPTGIGPTEVEVIRTLTATVAGIENTLGGAAATTAGLHQLRWARSLLTANAAPQIHLDLVEAVGNLAQVVAFSLYDTERVDNAHRCFNLALRCADEAGSWSLRACVLADIARLHADTADLDTALSAIEFAQVRHDRTPATGRAMLGVMRARYLAWDGRADDARHQLDVADNWFTEADPTIDPPWLSYYDLAEHHGAAGRALAPIAIARKDPTIAAPRLRTAVNHQSDAAAWLDPEEQAWLNQHLANLQHQWDRLPTGRPDSVIHGDAWQGNIAVPTTQPGAPILLDLEHVATGPPEWDLAPLAADYTDFNRLAPDDYQAFVNGYNGYDITTWPGHRTLIDLQELRWVCFSLSKTTAADSPIGKEARHRIACLRSDIPRPWTWTAI